MTTTPELLRDQGMATATECWLPVVGATGYEVSSLGRVRSWVAKGAELPLNKKLRHNPYCGYVWVDIRMDRDDHQQAKAVHRLVAEAFLGPRPDGMLVRHLDGDDQNNRLDNLRYGTPRQNNLDTVAHGRHNFASRDSCKNGHPFTPENTLPRRDCNGRACRECNRIKALAYYHRKRLEHIGVKPT